MYDLVSRLATRLYVALDRLYALTIVNKVFINRRMTTRTLRFTLLALTATVVFTSCKGKNDTPTPSPDVPNVPNGKHAERKDVTGKVEQMTIYRYDTKGQMTSSSVITFDRQLHPLTAVYLSMENGKLVPSIDHRYIYDSEGHLINHKYGEVGFPGFEEKYTYLNGLLMRYEEYSESAGRNTKTVLYTNDKGKRVSSYTVEQGERSTEKTEMYSSFAYKDGKEIETVYSDKARTKIVKVAETIYDDLGRIIQQETRGTNMYSGKPEKYHYHSEKKYGIFGEELSALFDSYDEKGTATMRDLDVLTYTKYNDQGLPIEGIETSDGRQEKTTIEYKFFK